MIPYGVTISGYRSLEEPVEVPFNRKFTFVAGQNNVGKSNLLKALAIIANKSPSHLDHDEGHPTQLAFALHLSHADVQNLVAKLPVAGRCLSPNTSLDFEFRLHRGGIDPLFDQAEMTSAFPGYFDTSRFRDEFSTQSGVRDNISTFINHLKILDRFGGSTYLPHLRFITTPSQEPPRFLTNEFPGETIAFGSVIERLAQMDRPEPSQRTLKDHLSRIQDFLSYCLEKTSVQIEVAFNRSTITISIDGEERSLGKLGTGVEQLLMVGLASMGFENKLVLIDEPELHLHPRAQKRMLAYLDAMPKQSS